MISMATVFKSITATNDGCNSWYIAALFIILSITSPYRCDNSDNFPIDPTTASVNISNFHKATSINSQQAIITGDTDVHNSQQIPLVRLPSNTLLKYTAYKDVSIQHFRIPIDTRSALFSFKSYEESKSAFPRVCQAQDVTLHLKAGSYPVISPESIPFPKHFLSAEQRFDIHTLQFKSDGVTRRMNIEGPHPGNWFAVAFISWTDPNNERIEQQGLSPSCETLLLSEMAITRASLRILNSQTEFKDTLYSNASEPKSFKFFVPRNVDICTFRLTITKPCENCASISFFVQSHSLPTHKNYLQSTIINASSTNETIIDFYPHENSWHFVDLQFYVPIDGVATAAATVSTKQQDAASKLLNYTSNKASITAVHHIDYTITIEYRHYTEQEGDDDNSADSNKKLSQNDHSKYIPPIRKNRIFDDYPVLRQTFREFFMYDYDLVPDVNGSVPLSINLTAGTAAMMKFDVGDVYDIGGTLTFAIAMRYDITGNPIDSVPTTSTTININDGEPVIAEKLVAEEIKARSNQTVIICMRLNEPGIPTWPDKCVYGRQILAANSVINNTDSETGTGVVHVPFPETGTWYVTMGLFCNSETVESTARTTIIDSVKNFIRFNSNLLNSFKPPCSCAVDLDLNYYRDCLVNDKCLNQMNETETLKIKECLMDAKCTTNEHTKLSRAFDIHHKQATEKSVNGGNLLGCNDGTCNASVVFTLSSSPCVTGRCGRNGRCYHYMSGGFVFSTCLCLKYYRGWDCTEDSQVPSSVSILVASMLLTLSNLLFIPSIYFAIRREYYTEAVIYFFAMFFSTFYHACDSGEEEFSFCLVKISVLQFCDFYCGLLAIWVTLIAMANIRPTFVSLFHMFGAILLAFGTELNKQSLWVFLAPALTGICIISVSWGTKCRKTKKLYPSKKYLAIYLPLGSVLVMIGLVCYAFLQTKQNYHIVHSIWHMVMALSILCLLPNRKVFTTKC